MNKLIVPVILLVAVLLVSGCSQDKQTPTNQSQQPPQPNQPANPTTQSLDFSVSSKSAAPGALVELAVDLKTNGLEATSLQFDISYDAAGIESVTAEPGLMTLSADKVFESNMVEGRLRVVIASLNNIKISEGEIAKLKVKLKTDAKPDLYQVELKNIVAVNKDANRLSYTATPGAVTSAEGQSTEHTIEITSSGFNPKTLTIKAGDTVTFVNKDSAEHWPASAQHPTHKVYPGSGIEKCGTGEQDKIFDACEGLAKDESWSFIFNEKGTWKYHDHLVSGLFGTIVVE